MADDQKVATAPKKEGGATPRWCAACDTLQEWVDNVRPSREAWLAKIEEIAAGCNHSR